MKRKIGKLYNKTIIEGDINLKTPNEIHKNELNKGGGELSKRSSWRYFDVSKLIGISAGQLLPTIVRYSDPTSILSALGVGTGKWEEIKAIGVDGDGFMFVEDNQPYTWNEGMALEGMTPETMAQAGIIEITEEEFLNKTFE